MLTLERIRKNQESKQQYEKYQKENYKSRTGSAILGGFMKELNLKQIKEFVSNNNLSEYKENELISKYHKLLYYLPTVTRYKKIEAEFLKDN
tara:strand:+ start:126 stop:401 length:276 start_codon:yes stop_codon:yes gene_type:complete